MKNEVCVKRYEKIFNKKNPHQVVHFMMNFSSCGSVSQLCRRIMREHNVGMWCDGENPLFKERLGAQRTSADPAGSPTTDQTQAQSRRSGDARSPNSSPQPKKRPRLSTGEAVPEADKGEHSEKACVESADDALIVAGHGESRSKAGAGDSLNPSLATESEAAGEEKSASDERTECSGGAMPVSDGDSGTERKTEPAARKEFDPERWVPDPLCESCQLKYIDPKPCDLLLYLHAHKYKVNNTNSV